MRSNHANEQLVARVQQITGLTHREAQVSVIATTMAIRDQLLEGLEVTIRGLGSFHFRMVRARKIPQRPITGGRVLPSLALPDRPRLRFSIAEELRQKLARIQPVKVRRGQRWSDKRPPPKPRPTPNPNPKPEGSASPSNQASAGEGTLE